MDLATLSQLARSLPRAEFLAGVKGIFLAVASTPGALTMGFRTEIARPAGPTKSRTLTAVYPVAKAQGNPYPDRISLGRAPNCDIVLRVPSVSKLHAHLLVRPGDRRADVFDLVDQGSHNGSRVNGIPVKPQEPTPVTVGDLLQFGEVSGELIDAGTLFGLLQ